MRPLVARIVALCHHRRAACRDREGWPMLEHAMRDLRYAIRVLVKRPILLATTTISIGVGVGINVAVFSVLRAVLFQTGPTAHASEHIFNVKPGLSYPNYSSTLARLTRSLIS